MSVGFVGPDDRFTASVIEFSPFGLSAKSARTVKTGTIYRLGLKIDADYFRAAAIVRSQFDGGFAVEFLSMTNQDRQLIQRLYQRVQFTSRDTSPE